MIVGVSLGVLSFTVNLIMLGNVFNRQDVDNNKYINYQTLINFVKAPLCYSKQDKARFCTVWGLLPGVSFSDRVKMMSLNWIVCIGTAVMIEQSYYKLLSKI